MTTPRTGRVAAVLRDGRGSQRWSSTFICGVVAAMWRPSSGMAEDRNCLDWLEVRRADPRWLPSSGMAEDRNFPNKVG